MSILAREIQVENSTALAHAQRMNELVKEAEAPADVKAQPGKIRTASWIFLGLTVVSLAVAVIMGPGDRSSDHRGFFALMVFSTCFFGLFALGFLISDALVPGVRARRKPYEAVECFVKSVRRRSWSRAQACVHPDTRSASALVPRLYELDVTPRETSFQTTSGFKRYWKAIFFPSGGTVRRIMSMEIGEAIEAGPDRARATVLFQVERFPALAYLGLLGGLLPLLIIYMITRKRVTVELQLTLFKHRSQWWVLPGEPVEPAANPRFVR
jgi:hypothetical protein